MIKLITDAVTLEQATDTVKKVLDTEPWRRCNAVITNVTTAEWRESLMYTPRTKERCWAFEISNQMRYMHLFVSKENPDEAPFAEVHDSDTDEHQRRHVCPVTGKWVENYNTGRHRRPMMGDPDPIEPGAAHD
jgi:hypothetical protein